MSNLLINEYPLIVIPSLAVKVGLNEAIFLQQLHYWLQSSKHEHQGKKWVYNTYEEWQKQFPFWSLSTTKRVIRNLENNNLLLVDNFNKLSLDKTKWYTINYSKLRLAQNDPMDCSNWTNGEVNLNKAIPETTTETTDRDFYNDNGCFSDEKPTTPINEEVTKLIGTYMNELYIRRTRKKHPRLKIQQHKQIYENISNFMDEYSLDYDSMIDMMNKFLNSNIYTDYNLNHFATNGIMLNRMYEEFH